MAGTIDLSQYAGILYPDPAQVAAPAVEAGADAAAALYPQQTADLSATLPAEAAQKYGFLKNNNVKAITNIKPDAGYAETWPVNEEGDKTDPRPSDLPIDKAGVEIRSKDFSADDYAAEVFSHVDPKGVGYADSLLKTLSPSQVEALKQESADYSESKKEGMPEDAALRNASMAAVRAYVFGQWPKESIARLKLTGEQTKMLDAAKSYAKEGK